MAATHNSHTHKLLSSSMRKQSQFAVYNIHFRIENIGNQLTSCFTQHARCGCNRLKWLVLDRFCFGVLLVSFRFASFASSDKRVSIDDSSEFEIKS